VPQYGLTHDALLAEPEDGRVEGQVHPGIHHTRRSLGRYSTSSKGLPPWWVMVLSYYILFLVRHLGCAVLDSLYIRVRNNFVLTLPIASNFHRIVISFWQVFKILFVICLIELRYISTHNRIITIKYFALVTSSYVEILWPIKRNYLAKTMIKKWDTCSWYCKTFFFANKEFLHFFAAKLDHFSNRDFFLCVIKHSN